VKDAERLGYLHDLITVGEHFDSLDRDGQRDYLMTRDIRVEKATPDFEPDFPGIRVVIDGEDHGVFTHQKQPPWRMALPVS
jgi:hypothetical protein